MYGDFVETLRTSVPPDLSCPLPHYSFKARLLEHQPGPEPSTGWQQSLPALAPCSRNSSEQVTEAGFLCVCGQEVSTWTSRNASGTVGGSMCDVPGTLRC